MGDKLKVPPTLDYRQWDKQKGIIAKVVKKKTGITEALKDFEHVYNFEFGWGLTGNSEVAGYAKAAKDDAQHKDTWVNHLERGLDECKGKETFLGKLQTKLNVVKGLADKNAAEFKKSSVIPSSSRVYLENMSKACVAFVPAVRKELVDSEKRILAGLQAAGVKV